MDDWKIFQGKPHKPHDESERLRKLVPPWRKPDVDGSIRARTYVPSGPEVDIVNAALYLRRPLLLTGPPGTGKSSLAYAIAEELKLGPVLKWPINSRSTLLEGLYHYDAISRLRDAQLGSRPGSTDGSGTAGTQSDDVSEYLQLQWLGTALALETPRVVLLDEIDKADIDLPNDLLHVLEEGAFPIPELLRVAGDEQTGFEIRTCELERAAKVKVKGGIVRFKSFPIIVLTSNGERELPLALHRRCLRLEIDPPLKPQLEEIVRSHLKEILPAEGNTEGKEKLDKLIDEFLDYRQTKKRVMATDQLLNAIYLIFQGKLSADEAEKAKKVLFRGLQE